MRSAIPGFAFSSDTICDITAVLKHKDAHARLSLAHTFLQFEFKPDGLKNNAEKATVGGFTRKQECV